MWTVTVAWGLAAASWAGKDPCSDEEAMAAAAVELLAHYNADRADRDNSDPDREKNTKERLKAVGKLVDKGVVCEPEPAMHAAWVLQSARDAERLVQAFELAKTAMEGDIHNGKYLSAVLYDLVQVSRGASQRYATQMASEGGKVCLYPLQPDATDDDRAVYDIRPIEETYRALLDANGHEREAATKAVVDQRNLWCKSEAW